MDIDNTDIDLISCQFRTMNTNDKDHLISEFKRLSKTELSNEGCCFYLDLAEWNLNTALWAYYEYEANNNNNNNTTSNFSSYSNYNSFSTSSQMGQEVPEMRFLCDISYGEGESVPPNTNFIKTWRLQNSGTTGWPSGCQLKFVNGYNFKSAINGEPISDMPVNINSCLEPGNTIDLSVSLVSPDVCGMYQCQFRAYTSLNQPFGDPIWLLLNVEQGGILGITQQLNSVNMFGQHNQNASTSSSNNELRLDSNSNFIQNPFNFHNKHLQHNYSTNESSSSPTTSNNHQPAEDEKRPDFYDDMFS
jgi:hypothetical protein